MNVDFLTAIKLFFANYVNFRGRSTRAEYWFAMLFVLIASIVLSVLSVLGLPYISTLFSIAVFLPGLAICFRRFHDAGQSGWLVILLYVLSFVGLGIMYGPMLSSIIEYANDPIALQQAMLHYMSTHIGSIGLGALIVLAAAVWELIILVKPSAPDNKYGPNPYGEYK